MLKFPAALLVCCVLSGAYMLRAAGQGVTDSPGETGSQKTEQILNADMGHFPEQISSDGGDSRGRIVQIGADARPVAEADIASDADDPLSLGTQDPEALADCQLDAAHLAIIASLGWHGMDFSDDCRILQWIATDQGRVPGDLLRRRIADEALNRMPEVSGPEPEDSHPADKTDAPAPDFPDN
jgi:hypothetical protein